MATAVPGVTTAFTLNSAAPTQLALANNGRSWLLITNNDTVATVYVAFGTNNNAAVGMIPIPPSGAHAISYLELATNPPKGDVSCIADQGTPTVSYTEG